MELEITEKKEEPLLSRIKIKAEIDFDNVTPSKEELKSRIASSLNASENLIVVKNIYTKFGEKKANALAYCYKSEEDIKKIEPKPKKKKEVKKKAEKKEEKPKEGVPKEKEEPKKEEKPKKEVKEETPKKEKAEGK